MQVAEGSRPKLICPLRAVSASTNVRWLFGDRELLGAADGFEVRQEENGDQILQFMMPVYLDKDDGRVYICEASDNDGLFLRFEITFYVTRKQFKKILCGCFMVSYKLGFVRWSHVLYFMHPG